MAKSERPCLVCGRMYTCYDAAPRLFCSVGCEADAGSEDPVMWSARPLSWSSRPAKTAPRKESTRGEE
jgi:hypothetical protein